MSKKKNTSLLHRIYEIGEPWGRPFFVVENFGYNGTMAVVNLGKAVAAFSQANFLGFSKKRPGVILCTVKAIVNLTDATIGTAGILLLGRKRKLKGSFAVAGAGLVVSAGLAYNEGYLQRKPISFFSFGVSDSKRCTTGRPTNNDFFSQRRPINFDGIYQDSYPLNPGLLRKYKSDPDVKAYVDLIFKSAKAEGINPVLFANQLYEETMGFNAEVMAGAQNGKGAIGAGQFKLSTAVLYFADKSITDKAEQRADVLARIKDWKTAIPMSAKFMSILKEKHGGDQILAMIEYNGGPRPIRFVQRQFWSWYKIGGEDWMQYMRDRRQAHNKARYCTHAWHNETFKYVGIITGASWSDLAHKYSRDLSQNIKISYAPSVGSTQLASHANDESVTGHMNSAVRGRITSVNFTIDGQPFVPAANDDAPALKAA